MTNTSYSSIETFAYIKTLSLEERKKLGQYMTPNFLGSKMAKMLAPYIGDRKIKVLDPAVGTGELLLAFSEENPNIQTDFYGFDIDPGMLTTAKKNVPNLTIVRKSIFDKIGEYENSFDFIIGNPPYFEIKKDLPELKSLDFETKNETGRLNMYALFFEYSLKLLKPNGIMVFLVPPSMNNGAYFKQTREYILKNSTIEHLEIIRENKHFTDALTSVQIIMLRKRENTVKKDSLTDSPFVMDFNSLSSTKPAKALPVIFTDKKSEIEKMWKNKISLAEAGFGVKTGNIIWNQNKEDFNKTRTQDYVPLLYSKDIKNNKLKFNPMLDERRWLPITDKATTVPSIIVNRIVGSLNNPQIKYALVEEKSYFTENHVNVITFPGTREESLVRLTGLTDFLATSEEWLSSYLQAITGNTQISATELLHLIPFVPKE